MNHFTLPSKKQSALLLAGILLVALNLRPALASLGPLVEEIRITTGLPNVLLGLLTSLPLISFGVLSILAPVFTKRFGIGKVLFGALILLTLGIIIRSTDSLPLLYVGTMLLGVAIAFGNVLLPTLTKRNFSSKSGLITSLYSSTMAIGASFAAGISVPLSQKYDLGWRGSLRVWAVLSVLALVVWMPQLWRLKKIKSNRNYLQAMKNMMRKPLAWKIAMFMGLQSFAFYVILTWLPTLLISRGFNTEWAGYMLSLSQATGILGSLLIPYFAGKSSDQRTIVIFLITIEILSLLGLLFQGFGPEWIWVSLIGFVLGGSFGLALLFLVLRSSDTETAAELSGMVQSAGYLIAATGPILIGSLFDYTGSWDYPLIVLILLSVLKLFMGLASAKPEKL